MNFIFCKLKNLKKNEFHFFEDNLLPLQGSYLMMGGMTTKPIEIIRDVLTTFPVPEGQYQEFFNPHFSVSNDLSLLTIRKVMPKQWNLA